MIRTRTKAIKGEAKAIGGGIQKGERKRKNCGN